MGGRNLRCGRSEGNLADLDVLCKVPSWGDEVEMACCVTAAGWALFICLFVVSLSRMSNGM
jgi:hypothetical protein